MGQAKEIALGFFFPFFLGALPLAEPPLVVDEAKREVRVYGRIFPHRFNEARGGDARFHLLAWKEGTSGSKALVETPVDDRDFYEALLQIGAEPGNNLSWSSWAQRHLAGSPAPERKVEGSPLLLTLFWEGSSPGLPLHRAFRHKGEQDLFFRFGGNRRTESFWLLWARRPGCLVCLYSCPVGKVSNAKLAIRDYMEQPERFWANTDVLPPDGTSVMLSFRLPP